MEAYKDVELVQEARRGNSRAFDLLVQRYWEWAVAIAHGLVGDHSLAQDIAQEAFIVSWQKLHQLSEPGRFRRWLRRIVINQAMMHLRRSKPIVSLEDIEQPESIPSEMREGDMTSQESIQSVYTAMRSLSVRHRLLMALFYVDGLSQRDIGELLEIPESTVKSRLHDARTRIRRGILMGNTSEKPRRTVISLHKINLRPLEEDSPWLEDIDLEVKEGELLVISGPQYCGKYELLKIIGLLEKPDSGSVKVDGVDTSELDPLRFVEMKVGMFGYIWQQPQLSHQMSSVENVVLPLIAAGVERASCIERAVEVLRFVGLEDEKRDAPARQLSLLDQQKIALARALIGDPEVIIAKEPTGNMRSSELKEFDLLLDSTVRERNVSVVCTSHDLNIMKASDRMVWLDNGRVARVGTFDEGPPEYVGRNACIFRYPASLFEKLYYSRKYKGAKEDLLRNATEKYQQLVKRITVLKGERESTDEDLIELQIKDLQEAIGMLNDIVSSLQSVLKS
jgi:RNA polymerase sigma factor (sigma-70 family)